MDVTVAGTSGKGYHAGTARSRRGLVFAAVQTASLVCFLGIAPATADVIRIASWNLNNLHFATGEALRARAPVRTDRDFEVLNEYRARVNADIVALQEVNGPAAARRIFPAPEYTLYFSGRFDRDRAAPLESDRIYTGFAVRAGAFDRVTKSDYSALSVAHGDTRRPMRWGVVLEVERGGRRLTLLDVHLKSGCFRGSLEAPTRPACSTLSRQVAPLEGWVEAQFRRATPFMVVGDFNRAFDVYGDDDHLWRDVDDGVPAGLRLWRIPAGMESGCWTGTRLHHHNRIDFFVLDARAFSRARPGSFRELDYDPADRDVGRRTPSDHCPIVIEYDL